MKELSFFYSFAILLILIFAVRYLARFLLYKLSKEEQITKEEYDSLQIDFKIPKKDKIINILEGRTKEWNTDNKKSIIPKDANDIQNLNSKYNIGTYRASNGRYKSLNK
jgi:hypothetical protein